MERFRRFGVTAFLLFIATPGMVRAGYLDENPDEVFSSVYERLGPLPVTAARDPFVWLRLQELKREPCDQKSIGRVVARAGRATNRIAAIRQPPGKHFVLF